MPLPNYHPIPDVAHFSMPWSSLSEEDPSSYRQDGSMKGPGWLGPYKNPKGQMVSEYSIGVELDDEEMDIPSLVPGLTPQEIREVILGKVSDSVAEKAVAHAKQRLKENKSVWATEDDYKAFMSPPKTKEKD